MDYSQFHVWTETDKIYIYSPVPPYEMAKPVEGKDKLENSNKLNFEKVHPQVLMDETLFTNPLLSQVTSL